MNRCDWKQLVLGSLTGVSFLLASINPFYYVQAQGVTSLVVDPEVSQVPRGNEISLQLVVTGGLNVNAYDVTVEYDEERLELMSWEHGDYLNNLAVVYLDDSQPGLLRLAATQLATPAVSGDGVLLELTFSAKEIGTASVEIAEVVFADSGGNFAYPDCESGDVLVTSDPTYTATATKTTDPASKGTQTSTLTKTPTWTKTPTMTRTPTPTQKTITPSEETFIPSMTRTATDDVDRAETTESNMDIADAESGHSQVDDAYPVQETATPVSFSGAVDQMDDTGDLDWASSVDSDTSENAQGDGSGDIISTNQARWANLILWSVLIAGLITIVTMLIVLIGRRKNEQEDLLL